MIRNYRKLSPQFLYWFKWLLLLLILSLRTEWVFCQDQGFFKSNDRVCFVGNSITNNGEFYHNVLLYHITRFPGIPIAFYNCGISGDVTGGILRRMDDDILIHQPTVAVIMIGMNDMTSSLFAPKIISNPDTLQKRVDGLNLYKTNLEKIINIFLDKNIRVILQKPSIYDQTAVLTTPILLGKNDALKLCADFCDDLSRRYKLPIVDYWSIMMRINTDQQQRDSCFTITSSDRVHPNATGHFVMAYQFLKTEKLPQYVSKIIVEKGLRKSQNYSFNCKFNKFNRGKESITFSVIEHSLPFPVVESQQKALKLVPFIAECNMEVLQVKDMAEGNYELSIDSISIGIFSGKQLREGINLAEFSQAPQYLQAMKVRAIFSELWKDEANLRGIKFIEYNQYFKDCPDKKNIQSVVTYLDSVFTQRYTNPYYKNSLKKYALDKPHENVFRIQSDNLRKKAYMTAKPVEHSFTIIRK